MNPFTRAIIWLTYAVLFITSPYECVAQTTDSLLIINEFKEYRGPYKNEERSWKYFQNFCNNTFNQNHNKYFVGMAFEELGIISCNRNELKAGIALFDSSYVYSKFANDSVGMATSKNWIGLVYQNLGHQDLAIKYYLEAFNLVDKIGNRKLIIIFQSNIASLYYSMRQYENSLKYQRRSYSIAKSTDDPNVAGLARVCADLSLVFIELGQEDSAKYYNNEAEAIAKKYNEVLPLIDVHLNNFRIYRDKNAGFAKEELASATKALENKEIQVLGIPEYAIGSAYQLNADLALAEGRLADAENYFNKSLEIALRMNSLESQKVAYDGLMRIAARNNNFKMAYEFAEKVKSCSDSLFSKEKENTIQQFAILYETDKKEKEIAAKENELQQSKNELKKKNYLVLGSTILLLLMLVGGYFIYINFRLKKKIEQQEALINERKRISAELHDDLGAQLSVAKIFLNNLKKNASDNVDSIMIENSLNMVQSSIGNLQNIMQDLQNTTLENQGYLAATEELVNKISHLETIHFLLSHTGFDERPDKKTEHNLFRVTQELINNSLKHSFAKNISLDIVLNDNKLTLVYEDDGKGFDIPNSPNGHGLENIRQRISALNGIVTFDTKSGRGFRTIIELQIQSQN